MNKIIFAGKSSKIPPSRTGNCFTIAIPSEHTEGGSVFWESGGCRYEPVFAVRSVFILNLFAFVGEGGLFVDEAVELFVVKAAFFKDGKQVSIYPVAE